jgi:hypothetical protein
MSKFIERLKQVTQPVPQPMGFRPNNATQQRPRIQLIARVEGEISDDKLSAADASVFTSGKLSQSETVKGIWLKNTDKIENVIKAEADFIVMPADSQVINLEKKIGRVLEISIATTDLLLRITGDLPIDAVIMAEDGSKLTWQKLMQYQRFAALIDKPVIVQVMPDVSADELQSIWETGVSGILVKIAKEAETENLLSIRNKIDKLTFPVRRRKDKIQATLPKMSAPAEEPDEDEEDE